MMLAYKNIPALFLVASILFFSACQRPAVSQQNAKVPSEKPAWLQQKIQAFGKENPANPPVKIYSYQYKDQLVYFITGRCCDIPSELYSVEGQQLCQPDGGFSGRGDGKCADFFETRSSEKLIWEDLRK